MEDALHFRQVIFGMRLINSRKQIALDPFPNAIRFHYGDGDEQ